MIHINILKKNQIFLHTVLFALLGHIIIYNGLPTALQITNYPPGPPDKLDIFYLPLNIYYIKDKTFDAPPRSLNLDLIKPKTEYPGDNHLLLPVYRAVKSGTHLSNLGYNEGFAKKDESKENIFEYKSLFSSNWNNMAEILYFLIPKHLKYISTPEQEWELAKWLSNFRFFLSYFHLLGLILLFLIFYNQLGKKYAWALGIVFVLHPGILFTASNLYYFTLGHLFFISYVVYAYPILWIHYTYKNLLFYILGFTIISVIFSFFGSLYYLLYTWAPGIALMFLLDICRIINKSDKTYRYAVEILSRSFLNIISTALISLIFMSVIFYHEIQQMIILYGPEAIDIFKSRRNENFMHTVFLNNPAPGSHTLYKISNIYEFIKHYYIYLSHILKSAATLPGLWIERFMPSLLQFFPPFLLSLKLWHLLISFIIISLIALLKTKNKEILKILQYFLAGIFTFLLWTLGLNFISTVAASHRSVMTGWVYSYYIDIALAILICKLWEITH